MIKNINYSQNPLIKQIKNINSCQNPLIKQINSLKERKNRLRFGQFIAEGLNTIKTMLQGPKALNLVYLVCTEQTYNLALNLVGLEDHSKLITVSTAVMSKISTASTPSDLLAVFAIPQVNGQTTGLKPGLVLAQIADPGNMGTLMRTAAAMGYQTIVIVEGCDPWSPKVIQASAGNIALLDIFELNWPELIAAKKSLNLCALVVKDGQKPENLSLKESLIVVGNEANGLPKEWLENCEQRLTLPMPGQTESLNAAVAGAIALYLAANQK